MRFEFAVPGNRALVETARELFLEYSGSLDFSLGFQHFDDELESLPGEYSPPSGRLIVAFEIEEAAGCIALRKIDDVTCEMKRLYVRPRFRGSGTGRKLASLLIREAREIGYARMRLDTVPSMTEAISLYRSLGFRDISRYRSNPIDGALFMELAFADSGEGTEP